MALQTIIWSSGTLSFYPKLKEGEGIKQFDFVMANPPWNQDGYDEEVLKKGEFWKQRFSYGFVPKTSADWAWIQHMVASAKDDTGKIGIVIDNGCLSRGGKEQTIRSRILDEKTDFVECIILLPEKLFYNTPATGIVIIFNKNKPAERKGRVLFVNASDEYESHREVRKLHRLGNGSIRKIADTYESFREEKGFSRVVSLNEISKQNDFNLNVTLYVMRDREDERINIAQEYSDMKAAERERQEIVNRLEQFLSELISVEGAE